MAKILVLGMILARLAQIWAAKVVALFFFKSLTSSFTRYYRQLSSCTISEKTNDPILRKLSNRWRDQGTDRQNDFIGCCPTNIERPKKLKTVHKDKEGDWYRKKKTSKISEVKQIKNKSKNLQALLETSPLQKEVLASHKLQNHPNE